ncbi:MAG: efflux RND transporter permease subunit [Verrucomicrobia bacterium]|nr:efflux RND transporter permease subunit [Verrucomicrobiota bacterium]
MTLPEFCIRRPIAATMFNLTFVVVGLVALSRLPVRELPNIDPPIVSVTTIYPGANAELVEADVTEPLEQELNNIPGIKILRSESREQVSAIIVEFELNHDVDTGAQDVRDRISRVRDKLPDDIKEPIVAKQDANAQEVMWVALSSATRSTLELTNLAERQIKDRLQVLPGVGGINFGGEKRPSMRIWLDSAKMAARQVTATDIRSLLQRENVELPSGRIEGQERSLSILARGRMDQPEQYENLVIRESADSPIRLRDVATVEIGPEVEETIARFKGEPAVGLGVVKQSDANAVQVAKRVRAELDVIRPTLPSDVKVDIPFDSSLYVEDAIHEVVVTLGISCLLVIVLIFFFLHDARATLIPAAAIPISILGTFALLYLLGYSVNILTLLALVLAIGIVVDDAIVVLENIIRHIEEGMKPFDASLLAMKEITGAVLAITASLIVVFLPIAFQSGTTGILFREFAIALAGSVAISAFVALTLSPALGAHFLRPTSTTASAFARYIDLLLNRLSTAYASSLARALRSPLLLIGLGSGILGLTVLLYRVIPQEFLPDEDKGSIIAIVITPEGSTSEATDRYLRQAEKIASEYPEVRSYFGAVALARGAPGQSNLGLMFIRLKEDRKRSALDIARPGARGSMFTRMISEIRGALVITSLPKAVGRGFQENFEVVLQGANLPQLEQSAKDLRDEINKAGFLSQPRVNFNYEKPQLDLEIDRNRAANLGISVRDISEALQILLGGLDISRFNFEGKQYDVIAQLRRSNRLVPDELNILYVRTRSGELVPIRDLVKTREKGSVNSIHHFMRQRSASVTGQPLGVTLGQAIEKTEEIGRRILPAGVTLEFDGEARELRSGRGEAWQIVFLALLIVYMALAAQFESLIHPFTIMVALPLAVFGAFVCLYALGLINNFALIPQYVPPGVLPAPLAFVFGLLPTIPSMNLNLYSLIGLVLLLGLVTKNSILLVEFANQRRALGVSAVEAMRQAGAVRLRPILMTALSTVIGILPIALGLGAGAESRRPLGVAVVGGMLSSTFLTLYLVPAFYIMVDRFRRAPQVSLVSAPLS